MSCQVSKSPYANEQGRKRKSNLGFILIKSDLLSHCTPNEMELFWTTQREGKLAERRSLCGLLELCQVSQPYH